MSATTGCSILGNYLGIDITGTSVNDGNTQLSSRDSIFVPSGSSHFIGDGSLAGRNVIGASNLVAISMSGNSSFINGNYIGTNAAGNDVFNLTTDGVVLNGTNNIVENNLISGITGSLLFGFAISITPLSIIKLARMYQELSH